MNDDGEIYGEVYEEAGRFYYHCKICCTSFSGGDERRIEDKADDHEMSHRND